MKTHNGQNFIYAHTYSMAFNAPIFSELSNRGICTKFAKIGQEIRKVRTKAHSCPYVKNDRHRVDFHENQVFQNSCEERHFRWRNISQTDETVRSQRIWLCTTYSTGTSLTAKSSPLRLRTGSCWVVYRHKNYISGSDLTANSPPL